MVTLSENKGYLDSIELSERMFTLPIWKIVKISTNLHKQPSLWRPLNPTVWGFWQTVFSIQCHEDLEHIPSEGRPQSHLPIGRSSRVPPNNNNPLAVRNRKPAKVQYHSLAFDLLNTDNRQDYNSAAAFQATKPGIKIEPLTHSYTAILGRFFIFRKKENQTTNKRQNHFDQQNSFGDNFRSTVLKSVF